ncbi:MAG: membrane protein insertion efficiency factor YidD [Desulfotignum sp.]
MAICMIMVLCLSVPGAAEENRTGKKNRIIRFYQDHISGANGSRCPMSPSCSEYAAQALEKHGPVMGWIMVFDRVMRCGRSETRLAPQKRINGERKSHDPVSANDFWWFKPPPDKMLQ